MSIEGKSLRDYWALLKPLFGVIAAVWLIRLVLSAAHVPLWSVKLFSVTAVMPLAVLLAALLIHVRNFGGYASVAVSGFLLTAWGQLLITLAIVFAVVTGTDNVFTVPEFSLPMEDPWQLHHIAGHLIIIPLGSLFSAAMGSFVLWLLRNLAPNPSS